MNEYFVAGKNSFIVTPSDVRRFWSRVDRNGDCWNFRTGRAKYGYLGLGGAKGEMVPAHRFSYWLTGRSLFPMILGNRFEIHHKCENPRCVNPGHLNQVSKKAHVHLHDHNSIAERRKRMTHCRKGHPLFGPNVRIQRDGHRRCKTCKNELSRKSYRESRPVL